MKNCSIVATIILITLTFGQSVKLSDARLSPRLLNYQGYLTDTQGNPITNSSLSLSFAIFDSPSGGSQKWTETQPTVSVDKGIFNVLLGSVSEIPDSVFNSTDRWVEMTIDGQTLTPRTQITAVGYAYTATFSDTAIYARNSAPDNDWSLIITDGADTTLQTNGRWGLARVGNTLYGNADSTHVNFGVANYTGTNGQNFKYCTVGGGFQNRSGANYATIAGGNTNYINVAADAAFIGGGYDNTASEDYAVTSGGYHNTATGRFSTVCGGDSNIAGSFWSSIAGGNNNTISATNATYACIGGGGTNSIGTSALFSTIAGGMANNASGPYSLIGGGYQNQAAGFFSTVAGGYTDTAKAVFGAVLGGWSNLAGDATTDTGATVCGGLNNTASARMAFVGGGLSNIATSGGAVVAGGYSNLANGTGTVVSGGENNSANNQYSVVAGGYHNIAFGFTATVAGGYYDSSYGYASFTANNNSTVPSSYDNASAFNGLTATASNQMRVGILSKAGGTFTIDHPLDPENKILNHYFVESPEMVLIYRGSAKIGSNGKAVVHLPDYFDALNKNPLIQLTGVGTSDIYIAEEVQGNAFVIGGKPGTKVHWTVTGERKDSSAEITKNLMPVEQPKEGALVGRSLDDEFLVGTMRQLERMGKASGFKFRHSSEENRYKEMKRMLEENGK